MHRYVLILCFVSILIVHTAYSGEKGVATATIINPAYPKIQIQQTIRASESELHQINVIAPSTSTLAIGLSETAYFVGDTRHEIRLTTHKQVEKYDAEQVSIRLKFLLDQMPKGDTGNTLYLDYSAKRVRPIVVVPVSFDFQ